MKFDEFNPKEIPHHFCIGVFGNRRTGKTVFVENMMTKLKDRFDETFLFNSLFLNEEYKFIPEQNRYVDIDLVKIESIMENQKKLIKDKIKNNVCIIIDNIVSSKKIKELCLHSRHLGISLICISQIYRNLSKVIRRNCDVLISFYVYDGYHKSPFVEENLSIIDRKMGMRLFNQLTSGRCFAIVAELYNVVRAKSYIDYVKYSRVTQ